MLIKFQVFYLDWIKSIFNHAGNANAGMKMDQTDILNPAEKRKMTKNKEAVAAMRMKVVKTVHSFKTVQLYHIILAYVNKESFSLVCSQK